MNTKFEIESIDFKKGNGLIPTIIQDSGTNEILILVYMNKEAFEKSTDTGYVYFWSRKRNQLAMKGEESGNILKIQEIYLDCDRDTLLFKVKLEGTHACHTGNKSCFYQKLM